VALNPLLPVDRQSAPEIVKNGDFRIRNSPWQGKHAHPDRISGVALNWNPFWGNFASISRLPTVFSCTNLDPVKPVSVDILLNDASGASLTVGIPSPNPLSNIGPDQTVTAVTNNASYFPSSNTVVLTVDSTLPPGSATIRSTKAKISCAVYLIDGSTPPKPLIPLPVVSGKQKGK